MARPATKKDALDAAAIHVIGRKGLAMATVKEIAARAGAAEGALYRHYLGKTEMAWELFRRQCEHYSARLEEILFDPQLGLEQRVGRFVSSVYRSYERDPVRLAFVLGIRHAFPGRRTPSGARSPGGVTAAFLAEAMRKRQIRKADPELLAALILGAVFRPVLLHHYGEMKTPPWELIEAVTGTVMKMISPTKR